MELDPNRTFNSENVIIITLDSCRYDAFREANTPVLNSYCKFRLGYAQATYTFPAHLSMLVGYFPSTLERLPYYNRHERYLFQLRTDDRARPNFIQFPAGTNTLAHGFRGWGYQTICVGAMEWFKHPYFSLGFEHHLWTGIGLERQIRRIMSAFEGDHRPVFLLLNIGETHDPYSIAEQDRKFRLTDGYRAQNDLSFRAEVFRKQIVCCEFIDSQLSKLIEWAEGQERDTIFVVCGDHGECMGEDGQFGHGFYHEKVMEVPLGIFVATGQSKPSLPKADIRAIEARQ